MGGQSAVWTFDETTSRSFPLLVPPAFIKSAPHNVHPTVLTRFVLQANGISMNTKVQTNWSTWMQERYAICTFRLGDPKHTHNRDINTCTPSTKFPSQQAPCVSTALANLPNTVNARAKPPYQLPIVY